MRLRLILVAALLLLAALLALALWHPAGSGSSSAGFDQPSAAFDTDIVLTPHGQYTDRPTGLTFTLGPASAQSLTEDDVCSVRGHPQDSFTARISVTNRTNRVRTVPTNWLEAWAGRRYITYGNADSQPITRAPPSVPVDPHATRTIRVHYPFSVGYGMRTVTIRWDDQSRVAPNPPPVVGTYSIAPSGFNPCSVR